MSETQFEKYSKPPPPVDFAGPKKKVRDQELVSIFEAFYASNKPPAEERREAADDDRGASARAAIFLPPARVRAASSLLRRRASSCTELACWTRPGRKPTTTFEEGRARQASKEGAAALAPSPPHRRPPRAALGPAPSPSARLPDRRGSSVGAGAPRRNAAGAEQEQRKQASPVACSRNARLPRENISQSCRKW
jgi:hypothetical protein